MVHEAFHIGIEWMQADIVEKDRYIGIVFKLNFDLRCIGWYDER